MAVNATSAANAAPPQFIQYLDNGLYEVGDLPPGNTKGPPTHVRKVDEETVNKILAPYGLKMVHGELISVDGFSLSGPSSAAATHFGDTPVLPDADGPFAPPSVLGDAANGCGRPGISDGALMWLALSTMAYSAMRDITDAAQIKHAMQQAKLDGKDGEIAAMRDRIDSEKTQAWTNFAVACVIAIATVIVAIYAPGMLAVAQAGGKVVETGVNAVTKETGAQSNVDKKQLEEKMWDLAQMNVDDANSNYEEAKELFKLAIRVLTEHCERQTQMSEQAARISS